MSIKINETTKAVQAMARSWPIVDALMGGTIGMREAGSALLPMWPNEEPASYAARLNVATLFPALARTVTVMAGKPFSKQATLSDSVPPAIVGWCSNIDQQGNSLHVFAAEVFTEALTYGLCGVLVDHPTIGADVKTLADERISGARPYAVFIKHTQILGWQSKVVAGLTVLTQLRLAEDTEVEDGPYGTKTVKRVRLLTPGAYELFEENALKVWASVEQGLTTLPIIPFVPFYGRKTGYMTGISPLIDLAYLNIEHWQSKSDQQTILHVARVPILVMIGADSDSALTVGASAAMKLPQDADLKFVEHSGKAIEAGQTSIDKLEEQMIQTGAELLFAKPGQSARTATESNNDAEANKSDLQRITEATEDGFDNVLQLFALWSNQPNGGNVTLFKDFASGSLSDASAQLVISMQQGGLITKRTALLEQQRRGMLSPDIDPVAELEAVSEEGPALGMMDSPMDASGGPVTTADPAVDPTPPIAEPVVQPVPVDLSPLVEAIGAMQSQIDAIVKPEPVAASTPIDLSPLTNAIEAIAKQVTAIQNEPDDKPDQAVAGALKTLQDQITELAARPEPVAIDQAALKAAISQDMAAVVAAMNRPQQVVMLDSSGGITRQLQINRDEAGNITGASSTQS